MTGAQWPGQRDPQDRVVVELPYWLASVRDPAVRAGIWLVAGVVAGFVSVAMAWRGAAPMLRVSLQLPFLVSGGVVGLAVIGSSMALLDIHAERRRAAARRAVLEATVRDVAEMAEAMRQRRNLPR